LIPSSHLGLPMPTLDLTTFRFAVSLTHKAFADVPEADLRKQLIAEMNPPVWILGHLVAVFGMISKLLTGSANVPEQYVGWFGPGSKIPDLPAELPTGKQLLGELGLVSEQLLVVLPKLTEEQLAAPNKTPYFVTELPTVRALLENLLVGHTMLHVGQMTAWRKVAGLPKIITIGV
jgi:uncharacterized damage-inducible protein DinB